jgi:hypothetical protein
MLMVWVGPHPPFSIRPQPMLGSDRDMRLFLLYLGIFPFDYGDQAILLFAGLWGLRWKVRVYV